MTVVLDTNVVVSGLLNPAGVPAQIVNLILSGRVGILYDNRIIVEYRDVLSRPKFYFQPGDVKALLDYVGAEGAYVVAEPQAVELDDPDDTAFYETAVSGGATYLITGNPRHFPESPKIVSPSEFVKVYRRKVRRKR